MKKKDLSNIRICKCLFLVFSLSLICMACNQGSQIAASRKPIEPADPLEGVWELESYYRFANEDTTFIGRNNNEHKIYLDGHVMWNHDPDPDSSEWHGFGTYTFADGMVTETLTTMSIPMRRYSTPTPMKIVFGQNYFEQVQSTERNGITYKQIWRYKKLK